MYYCTQMTQTGRRFTQIFLFFLMLILRSLKKICGHLCFSLRLHVLPHADDTDGAQIYADFFIFSDAHTA